MSTFFDQYQIIFVDLDGTLLDVKNAAGQKSISQANLAAMAKLQEAGKLVIVSTGRQGANARDLLSLVNARYAVLGNGSEIWVDGKIITSLQMSVQEVLLVYAFVRKHKLILKLDDEFKAYGAFGIWQQFMARKFGFVPQANYGFEMHKPRFKIVIWGHIKARRNKLIEELKKQVPQLEITTSSNGWTIEVTAQNASKGFANRTLAEYLKIDPTTTIHVGDSMNDASSARFGGKLLAMQNSDAQLFKVANFKGPHYRKAGFAKILNDPRSVRFLKER